MDQTDKPPRYRTWTDENMVQLKTLWADGKSCSEIAAALGGGVTRNMIVGKIHRLHLADRSVGNLPFGDHKPNAGRVARPKPEPKMRPARATPKVAPLTPSRALVLAKQPKLVPQSATAPTGGHVDLMQLSSKTCKWPIGDPGREGFCFCGHEPRGDGPYCSFHHGKAYQPLGTYRRVPSTGIWR